MEAAMKKMEFDLDGKAVSGLAEYIDGRVWCRVGDKIFAYEHRRYEPQVGAAAGGDGVIVAPMPGKVVKVQKSEGQEVKSNDVVIVIEAMKMEYSLRSDIDGAVSSIQVSEGEQVSLGQELARVE
jgi:biotin carboxyl carrier protein